MFVKVNITRPRSNPVLVNRKNDLHKHPQSTHGLARFALMNSLVSLFLCFFTVEENAYRDKAIKIK